MSIRVAIISLSVFGVMTGFQNCGSPAVQSGANSAANSTAQSAKEIVESVSAFNKIVYDPLLEMNSQNKVYPIPRLEIDVDQGSVKVLGGSSGLNCQLDQKRQDALKSILATAKVCEAKQSADPNTVHCMAAALADIQLSNGQSQVLLKPNMCGAGVFLCDDLDKAFREVLNSLRDNPPANCSII